MPSTGKTTPAAFEALRQPCGRSRDAAGEGVQRVGLCAQGGPLRRRPAAYPRRQDRQETSASESLVRVRPDGPLRELKTARAALTCLHCCAPQLGDGWRMETGRVLVVRLQPA
jgi:hypothetical protein